MKLDHFHIAQGHSRAQRHGQSIAALVARRRVKSGHRRSSSGGQQHGLGLDENEFAAARVYHEHPRERRSVGGLDEFNRAVLFEPVEFARPNLFGQVVDDRDASQIPLMDGTIERLASEDLLVHGRVGVSVEEVPSSFSSPRMRSIALVTRVLARSWSASHLLPSIVSMKWRAIESPEASAVL